MSETRALARNTDPGTSHEAAAGVRLTKLEQRVYDLLLLRTVTGLTTTEVARLGDLDRDSVSPRMKRLVEAGLVVDTGVTRVPQGKTKAQIVWKAVAK